MKQVSPLKQGAPLVSEAGARLRKVEALLDRAEEDLRLKGSQAPGAQCTAALRDAVAELRALEGMLTRKSPAAAQLENLDRAGLRGQLNALLPRLQNIGRLLAAAAEFYSGWCAAAPVPSYPAEGYEACVWVSSRGPALLAFEA